MREQPVEFTMKNYFDKQIDCSLSLEFEAELSHLQPNAPTAKFTLAPGASWSSGKTFTLKPGISDTLGPKPVTAVVTISTEGGQFTLRKTFDINLAPSQMELRVAGISRAGGDMLVRVAVKNTGQDEAGDEHIRAALRARGRRMACRGAVAGAGAGGGGGIPRAAGAGEPPERLWLGLRQINGLKFANMYLSREQMAAALAPRQP